MPEGEIYSPAAVNPDYVVEGPWSFGTGLYDKYAEQRCVLEMGIGPYNLYACAQ